MSLPKQQTCEWIFMFYNDHNRLSREIFQTLNDTNGATNSIEKGTSYPQTDVDKHFCRWIYYVGEVNFHVCLGSNGHKEADEKSLNLTITDEHFQYPFKVKCIFRNILSSANVNNLHMILILKISHTLNFISTIYPCTQTRR